MASDLETKRAAGGALTVAEIAFLDAYNGAIGDGTDRLPVVVNAGRAGGDSDDEAAIERLANTGWTDEARQASIAVRQAKAKSRSQGGSPAAGGGDAAVDGSQMFWPGGSPYFDEVTGQYVIPVWAPPGRVPLPPGVPYPMPSPLPPNPSRPPKGPGGPTLPGPGGPRDGVPAGRTPMPRIEGRPAGRSTKGRRR
jgi:hypothetical protein